MRPKKWREFQHYQDGRTLKWIKNYIDVDLPGTKFRQLSWADQGRLQALWRLAGRLEKDGFIPYDEQYLRAVLGDKRFTFGGQMLPDWFHIGTHKEVKRAANKENRSRAMAQMSSPKKEEVRDKKSPSPLLEVQEQVQKLKLAACPECHVGGGTHTADCPRRKAS